MRTFQDAAGQTWDLEANIATARRIRDLADFDLLSPEIDQTIAQIAADPILLVDVLWAWVKPQADGRNITDEQFGQAFTGEILDQAAEALLEELPDFFPSPGLRKNLRRVVAKNKQVATAAAERSDAILTDERLDQLIAQKITEAEEKLTTELERELGPLPTPGEPSTNSPESSVSTPPA
jgi:hypothetical protein